MKIIADQQIPYLSDFFGTQSELLALPDEKITENTVEDADVLLVRSVTSVDKALIKNTSLRFIGSATAGMDHIDMDYLDQRRIAWAYAPGCNAKAVADYVLLSVVHLKQFGLLQQKKLRAGIIGVGNVGQHVSNTLNKLGFDIVLNDPPRADNEIDFISTPLDQFHDLDLICMHTPLTTSGNYPTQYLIDRAFLSSLNPNCVLLNAGRGACIDTQALHDFSLTTVLDVWENEPAIDIALAESAFIATPHIAGYSQASKYRATKQLFESFCHHFEMDYYVNPEEDPSEYVALNLLESDWMEQAIKFENLKKLSDAFQTALKENVNDAAKTFKTFRKNYAFRPEFNP